MKTLILSAFFMLSLTASADQLAYITKEQAEEAAEYLMKHPDVFLFCGCCSLVEPQKVKVVEAQALHTGYEDYYEVEIMYEGADGEYVYERIDLAYVWRKKCFKYKTIGAVFNLEHDPCVNPKEWDDPKHAEKDI